MFLGTTSDTGLTVDRWRGVFPSPFFWNREGVGRNRFETEILLLLEFDKRFPLSLRFAEAALSF